LLYIHLNVSLSPIKKKGSNLPSNYVTVSVTTTRRVEKWPVPYPHTRAKGYLFKSKRIVFSPRFLQPHGSKNIQFCVVTICLIHLKFYVFFWKSFQSTHSQLFPLPSLVDFFLYKTPDIGCYEYNFCFLFLPILTLAHLFLYRGKKWRERVEYLWHFERRGKVKAVGEQSAPLRPWGNRNCLIRKKRLLKSGSSGFVSKVRKRDLV
jgi:hypothetical protein